MGREHYLTRVVKRAHGKLREGLAAKQQNLRPVLLCLPTLEFTVMGAERGALTLAARRQGVISKENVFESRHSLLTASISMFSLSNVSAWD